ncbi:MAG TPA: hypothetical protein VGD37_25360 [Kofleriaceae bacterium]|jgi:hypothetical protein
MRSLFVSTIVALAACESEPPAPPPAVAPASAAAPKLIEPSKELSPLVARLRYEANHRPASSVTAERVFDALDRSDIRVTERRQYLGASMRASYCLGGQTGDDIVLAVCEYPTHGAAVAGKAFMDGRFAAMAPGAHREVQDVAVLTVVDPAPRAHPEIVARAFQSFAALPPHATQNNR